MAWCLTTAYLPLDIQGSASLVPIGYIEHDANHINVHVGTRLKLGAYRSKKKNFFILVRVEPGRTVNEADP